MSATENDQASDEDRHSGVGVQHANARTVISIGEEVHDLDQLLILLLQRLGLLVLVAQARLQLLDQLRVALRVRRQLLRQRLQLRQLGVKRLELCLALLLHLLLRLLRLRRHRNGRCCAVVLVEPRNATNATLRHR